MDWTSALRAKIGRRLEHGAPSTALGRVAANAWAASARVARPLAIPKGIDVVGIGSAVLGGAGKTPLAIAIAREISANGARVTLLSHAYRARPGRARLVTPHDAVTEVGDDALLAARSLDGTAIDVLVSSTREEGLELAKARGAEVVVVDGLLQAAPLRLAASVLLLDGAKPWGSDACPPLGDLRATRRALLDASDIVAVLRNPGDPEASAIHPTGIPIASRTLAAMSSRGERVALESLAGERIGLLLAIARPERVVTALTRLRVSVAHSILLGDHARLSAAELLASANAGVDVWLTTARCATKLPGSIRAAPVLSLDHEIDASAIVPRIMNRLGRCASAPC